jgi:hypothetical protein
MPFWSGDGALAGEGRLVLSDLAVLWLGMVF